MNEIQIFTSGTFGKVRMVIEDDKTLFCASDVAKALGYSNAPDAISRHCRCIVKRDIPHPQSVDKRIEVIFIPEGDVYRLITHSKLPSALQFEEWVFEEVVPQAVKKQLKSKSNPEPEPEQLTLETDEYFYVKKTFNGEPVITLADFEHFTGVGKETARRIIWRYCKRGKEYYLLERSELARFKLENCEMRRGNNANALLVITKAAVDKLAKFYNYKGEIPMIDDKRALPAHDSPLEIEAETPIPSVDIAVRDRPAERPELYCKDCITAINVLWQMILKEPHNPLKCAFEDSIKEISRLIAEQL